MSKHQSKFSLVCCMLAGIIIGTTVSLQVIFLTTWSVWWGATIELASLVLCTKVFAQFIGTVWGPWLRDWLAMVEDIMSPPQWDQTLTDAPRDAQNCPIDIVDRNNIPKSKP